MWDFLFKSSPLVYLTQSLWRDEAYSFLMAERSIPFIIQKSSFEPPFYYLLLHYWIKIFGSSEIAMRALSLLALTLATIVVIYWAEKLFKKHWLSWFLPVFFFLNPMLLYYGLEVRTYAWYTFFAVLSMFAYSEKKWRLWVLATTVGFYTHSYMIFVPIIQGVHWLLVNLKKRNFGSLQRLAKEPLVKSGLMAALLISPWALRLITESGKLKYSWYFPVDLNLIKSVLGNMFVGYEGTPWFMWKHTAVVSIVLLVFFVLALRSRAHRTRNLFFFLMVILPLAIVIGISFIKPLFVNRYLIPVSVAEVFLLVFALESINNKLWQKLLAAAMLTAVVVFNFWYPPLHAKLDIRSTVLQVNSLLGKDDVIYATSPLIFFETIYYGQNRAKVFLYNPGGYAFPWYVGEAVVSPSQMVSTIPLYPNRAFMINEDGTYELAYKVAVSQTPEASDKE